MPLLSRLAFATDTALEVTAILMTEQRTETRRMAATLIGLGQPAPVVAGSLTEEMRSLLA